MRFFRVSAFSFLGRPIGRGRSRRPSLRSSLVRSGSLASGRPVVGAPIRSLLDSAGVATLARTPDEWSAALTASLTPELNAPEAVEARRAVAREHDWERLAARVARSLCEMLGPSELARLDALLTSGLPDLP